jgi:hypothetical protein
MDGFETSLGIPGAKIIESVHDRQQPNRQKQRKRNRKDAAKKKSKTEPHDQVTLSITGDEERDGCEKSKDKHLPFGKGDFIDIQA